MASPNQTPVRLTFGPFELDASTGELLKGGIRIRLAAQPLAILIILLHRPGETVTREEVRRQIWGDGTFVDFEHGLNAAINKLRRALSDSAEHPRYIETIPGRGYRFIGALDTLPTAPPPIPTTPSVEERPRGWRTVMTWERLAWAAAGFCCLILGLWMRTGPSTLPNWTVTRITADAGLSAFPALSPDGSLLAYSSDRGLNGEQDLYLRQVAGGEPVRLTFDGSGNSTPDFSHDGAKIVFRSNRNGGGIFEIPALGGEPRLLARGGWDPKYSPDGSLVAYWIGTSGVAAAVPGSGAVWIVPAAGGSPRRLAANFSAARQPIWLPDGKHLLIVGYTSTMAYQNSAIDWWVVPIDGAASVKTGLYDALVHNALRPQLPITKAALRPSAIPSPGCWSAVTNTVVFSLGTGEQADLWEIGLSPRTGKVNDNLRRLTSSTLKELYPTCMQAGVMAFTGVATARNVWSLPLDLDRGLPPSKSTLEPLTTGPSSREYASIAKNGGLLAFASNQSGPTNIWIRDLKNGKESPLASSSLEQHYPISSPSGQKIAFSVFEKNGRAVYMSAPGGPSEKLCDGCLRATDWSRDENTVLIFGGDPYQIDALDVASHQRTPILKNTNYNLLYARFSPDNRWVSFTARTQPGLARIVVAPLDGPKPVAESAWITLAEATAGDRADWSPDGRTLYFTSTRDGHSCFWAQRIEALSHRPLGEPFPVLHLHGRLYDQPGTMWGGWSVGSGRIAMVLAEDTGNIWIMSRSRSR